MLVKKLIDDLKEFNPNAEVTLVDSEEITLSYICRDTNGNPLDKQTTSMIFIEGIDRCPSCIHEYDNYGESHCSFHDIPCKDVVECYAFEEFDDL